MRKTIFVIVVLLLTTSCSTGARIKVDSSPTLEYGSDPKSLIVETDADNISYQILDSNKNEIKESELETDIPYTLVFTATLDGKENKVNKEITFIDTTPPTYTATDNPIEVEYESDPDYITLIKEMYKPDDNYSSVTIKGTESMNSTEDNSYPILLVDEKGNETPITVSIKISDITGPVINATKTSFTMNASETVPNFTSYATSIDNKDGERPVVIEGTYDSSKSGTYNLAFVSYDESDNKTSVPFTLTVVKKVVASSTNTYQSQADSTWNDSSYTPSQNTDYSNQESSGSYNGSWTVEIPSQDAIDKIHQEGNDKYGEGNSWGATIDGSGNIMNWWND